MTMTAEQEMRTVYAETLIELAEQDRSLVALEADLMKASGMALFKARFPDRVLDFGVAEANMVGAAAGMAALGKIPFVHTFACFMSRRAYDQVFISAAYARRNVKLIGSDPGVTAAYNGGTHMPFEDLGIMRNIPDMVVFEPSDPVSLSALTRENYRMTGCSYMRLHRKPAPVLYASEEEFRLGRGKVLRDGKDITLIATGVVAVNQVVKAAEKLGKAGISAAVIDMHTVKPMDEELVLRYAEQTGAILTCENHQIYNGLGSAVAEIVAEKAPVAFRRWGIRDEFGEVGPLDYLIHRYQLDSESIAFQATKLLKSKSSAPLGV